MSIRTHARTGGRTNTGERVRNPHPTKLSTEQGCPERLFVHPRLIAMPNYQHLVTTVACIIVASHGESASDFAVPRTKLE